MFQNYAENCVVSNLKRFNSKMLILKSMLCKCVGSKLQYKDKYQSMLQLSKDFEVIDYMWGTCKERLFLTHVLEACLNADLDAFADHVYYWHCVRPLDGLSMKVLQVLKDDLLGELARRREAEERERLAEEERKRQLELEKKAAEEELDAEEPHEEEGKT